ncbi:hypothetical protein PybrP1_012096 [[Pythium] brassicae (nom. inval.)]|nr:hypothetical protein PybrP1_012096 [[Pythium] brassicae (nom. inval.)]
MDPPAGVRTDGDSVCKLQRSIYGVKQSGAVWHRAISAALRDMQFEACRSDACLFVRRSQSPVFLALYVDDIIVNSRSRAYSNEVKAQLAARFTIKDMGGVRMLPGIRVDYDREHGTLHLVQASFIARLCERFGQSDATAVRSPSILGQFVTESSDSKAMQHRGIFRELVGALLYVDTCTRPDICAAVGRLSRHLEEPRKERWLAAIRVLRYLKGTADVGIVFEREHRRCWLPRASVDADWGSDVATWQSTSGVIVFVSGGPVIFRSKRQQSVALSSASAEESATLVVLAGGDLAAPTFGRDRCAHHGRYHYRGGQSSCNRDCAAIRVPESSKAHRPARALRPRCGGMRRSQAAVRSDPRSARRLPDETSPRTAPARSS